MTPAPTPAPTLADIAAAVERAARQRLVLEFLGRYPRPVALLYAVHPGLVAGARRAGVDDDDVNGMCLLGAWVAATKFDPARGPAFDTLAVWWMRSEVSDGLRKWTQYSRRREVQPTPMSGDGGRPETVLDLAPADDDQPAGVGHAAADLLAGLGRRSRRAVELRYGLDGGGRRRFREIGLDLGVSTERARQLVLAGERLARELAGVV